jgi:hypothetical protein
VRFLTRSRFLNSLFPVAQNFLHVSSGALQCLNVCFDTLELVLGKLVHAPAWSTPGITSFQNFTQFSQSESDPKRPLHYEHSLHSNRGIEAVTRFCSRGLRKNTDPFIVSNRVWTHSRRLRQGARPKSSGTAALHHKEYQPWNAFQSQGIFMGSLRKGDTNKVQGVAAASEDREFESQDVGGIYSQRPYSTVGEQTGSIAIGCGLRKKWR